MFLSEPHVHVDEGQHRHPFRPEPLQRDMESRAEEEGQQGRVCARRRGDPGEGVSEHRCVEILGYVMGLYHITLVSIMYVNSHQDFSSALMYLTKLIIMSYSQVPAPSSGGRVDGRTLTRQRM